VCADARCHAGRHVRLIGAAAFSAFLLSIGRSVGVWSHRQSEEPRIAGTLRESGRDKPQGPHVPALSDLADRGDRRSGDGLHLRAGQPDLEIEPLPHVPMAESVQQKCRGRFQIIGIDQRYVRAGVVRGRDLGDKRPPKLERHDFDTEDVPLSKYPAWFGNVFEKVVLVKKLRETRVLTGFSRLVPPEALDGPPAALSLRPKRWLPGFSVRGEGIFLQFNRAALAKWAAQRDVEIRTLVLQDRLNKLRSERNIDPRNISPELLMIHTFSHLVIRQLAFECGYDSSSIRERIYSSNSAEAQMSGLLLYTASGDSEGTLGGLVRQGEPKNLENTVKDALANASICSSDPLCIESQGQGTFSLNLAACHTCGLLPETSCEEGNLLLDRVMAIGTPNDPDRGYFGAVLNVR
jgi:hypothetical protein